MTTRQIVVAADAYAAMRETSGHTHIITDPPYTGHVHENLLAGTKGAATKVIEAGFDPLLGYDWLQSAIENTPRWGVFFCALEQLGHYKDAAPASHVRSGIYCKMRAMPQMSGDRPGGRCEGLAIFHGKEKKRWNGKGTHAFWLAMPEDRKTTMHPTAKPTLLCLRLVELFTDPGDTVFDPFCGTGAIGRACAVLGRNYIGCDNNPLHVENAKTRIAEALGQKRQWQERLELYKTKYPPSAAIGGEDE